MGLDACGRYVLGLNPWLPWPFNRWRWWTAPVRAERLAALRIALAAVMLVDILLTYLPDLHVFYGANSLSHAGNRDLFEYWFKPPKWSWSVLHGNWDPFWLRAGMASWIVAAGCMLIGLCTRLSVLVAWIMSISFANLNTFNDNAGDQVRTIALLYLLLSPSGAAWSVDSLLAKWLGRRGGRLAAILGRPAGPAYVYPWALCLLVVQMTFIYFINGLSKMVGPDWRAGNALYYVLNDLTIARWSFAEFPIPVPMTRLMTWSVLIWEFTFPFWMLLPWLVSGIYLRLLPRRRAGIKFIRFLRQARAVLLVFGVLFHLGIMILLELGFFGPYMMCLYVPLVPWERWLARRKLRRSRPTSSQAVGAAT